MTGRSGRTMREERRTYVRQRCIWREPTGARCRSRPTTGSAYCMLHEPTPVRLDRCIDELDEVLLASGHHPNAGGPMVRPTVAALCGHWIGSEKSHCDDPLTRRYLTGYRCVLHAPGATELACPHGVAWAEPCQPCTDLWGDPLDNQE